MHTDKILLKKSMTKRALRELYHQRRSQVALGRNLGTRDMVGTGRIYNRKREKEELKKKMNVY